MKIVRFDDGSGEVMPGILTERGVVNISGVTASLDNYAPQRLIEDLIDNYDRLKPDLEQAAATANAIAVDRVRLHPPLPRPSKILCCIGNYWEHAQRDPRPLNMFLKSPDAIIGPDDTVRLPAYTAPYAFQHEAELALVFKGPAKDVAQADWRNVIFGYTLMIDVSGREEGRRTWRAGSWMGKSFDTFAPMGPCIVTADEIPEPNNVHIQFWNDGELRHDYTTDDMEHRVPELVEFSTRIMTMNSGDVLSCGTNHEGLGFLQDGETCVIEGEGIGRFTVHVVDPLKRKWERGIYQGADSTYRGPKA